MLRAQRKSTQTWLPSSSAKSTPRDSSADRQVTVSLISLPCPYRQPPVCEGITTHLAVIQFYCLCFKIGNTKLRFPVQGYMQAAKVSDLSQEAFASYIFYFKSDSKAFSSASKILNKQHKIMCAAYTVYKRLCTCQPLFTAGVSFDAVVKISH